MLVKAKLWDQWDERTKYKWAFFFLFFFKNKNSTCLTQTGELELQIWRGLRPPVGIKYTALAMKSVPSCMWGKRAKLSQTGSDNICKTLGKADWKPPLVQHFQIHPPSSLFIMGLQSCAAGTEEETWGPMDLEIKHPDSLWIKCYYLTVWYWYIILIHKGIKLFMLQDLWKDYLNY